MNPYNPLKAHADYLRLFWEQYRSENNRKQSFRSRGEVIAGLVKAGDVFIYYSIKAPDPTTQEVMRLKTREKFDRVKNIRQRYRFKMGDECLACGDRPNVRHHIIWLKNGGRNNKRNICFLCDRCHAQVHPWLAK